ncbi:MAG TPA: hypothetical protein VKQ36_01740 [Ktedonobacterales bacterium]|nr:hypothetical protein [Ktedonobacterales bacterium]
MAGFPSRDRSLLKLRPHASSAFSVEDMEAYLLSAPSCAAGPTLLGQLPTIETLEFVHSKELSNRLHMFIRHDDALVCYVVLRGPFYAWMVSFPPGAQHEIPVVETVEEIYDVSTGDLLVWGLGRRPTQAS